MSLETLSKLLYFYISIKILLFRHFVYVFDDKIIFLLTEIFFDFPIL